MKSMNKREGKKIAVMAAVIMGFMVVAFMPMASAGVTDFTVTPNTGIAGAVGSYDAYVITDGVTSINVIIPAGFIAVAPTTKGVEIARFEFFNSSTKAYYGHAIITANETDPLIQNTVDIYWELGGDAITTYAQDVNYTAGEANTFESGFGDGSSAIIKLPEETENGSIEITINSTVFLLDAVMTTIQEFVRNPTAAGDYTFYADGKEAKVTIKEPSGTYGGGVRRGREWILRTENLPGAMVYRFPWGSLTDVPCPGDWNGNGVDGIGVYRNGQWIIRNGLSPGPDNRFDYGNPSDVPVTGNWDGLGGDDGMGVYRNGQWILRNDLSPGAADYRFNYGNPSDVPVTGDWDGIPGDGDGIGVYRNGEWILRNHLSGGVAAYRFDFGNPSDIPVTGDWNGDGEDGIGVYRNGEWILRNEKSAGPANYRFNYGNPRDVPVPGTWA